MIKTRPFLFAWLTPAFIALLALPAGAQEAKPPALQPPPTPGGWTVRYKDQAPKSRPQSAELGTGGEMVTEAAPVATIERADYTVDGNMGKCVLHYSDGGKAMAIVVNGISVQQNPFNPDDLVISNFSTFGASGTDFTREYPGLAWILPEFYKGIVELGEMTCHYFAEGEAPPQPKRSADDVMLGPDDVTTPLGGREAWLDAAGRPVQTKEGTVIATYKFHPASQVGPIEIPAKFKAKFLAYMEGLRPKEAAFSGNEAQ